MLVGADLQRPAAVEQLPGSRGPRLSVPGVQRSFGPRGRGHRSVWNEARRLGRDVLYRGHGRSHWLSTPI